MAAVADDDQAVPIVSGLTSAMGDLPETSFSLPSVIGSQGIVATLSPVLSACEHKALRESAEALQEAVRQVGF